MATTKLEYNMTSTEAQTVVLDWVKATEEFHQRYYQINEVINGIHNRKQQWANSNGSGAANYQSKVQHLLRLRQHMNNVLTTLLTDMSVQKPDRQQTPSKPGQLISHTRLLRDLNREIDTELNHLTVQQTIS